MRNFVNDDTVRRGGGKRGGAISDLKEEGRRPDPEDN